MKKVILSAVFSFAVFFLQAQQIRKLTIADIENYISSSKGQVLVINFWATFCKSCVAEIPSFIKITNRHKNDSVKLLLVSLDLPSFYPKKIAAFAKQRKFNVPIVWLNETNADYFCPRVDPKWSGSIPATLIINTKTGYRKFFEEEMEEAVFEKELETAISGN
ncbi:MAG: TlpA disulfide reductase family protein [Ferruginibacter sp.]